MFSFNISFDDIISTSKPNIEKKTQLTLKVEEQQLAQEEPVVLTPPFSVPLQNETGVFCFENVGFKIIF